MTTSQCAIVPRPLNPHDTNTLSSGDRVRITTTNRPRTILTVSETHSSTTHAPQLVLTAPPIRLYNTLPTTVRFSGPMLQ